MKVQKNIGLKGRVIFILKGFYLPRSYDPKKGQGAIDDLNRLLKDTGVSFNVSKNNNGQKLMIYVDEEKVKNAKSVKVGRPVEHEFNYSDIEQMRLSGKTNKQIYSELGMSKSLFYLKMKKYKNNKM